MTETWEVFDPCTGATLHVTDSPATASSICHDYDRTCQSADFAPLGREADGSGGWKPWSPQS